MLQHLLIRDLAVVSFADISFSNGMTVITGETGAGKSILLDALMLALGERSDSHLVRPGKEKAEICATFDIGTLSGAILWLTELELTCEDTPQLCIIRRILYANGRSKAFINGRPATTQQLRLLGDYLVQIHGQHQHQLLLKSQEQLRLLDAFGQHDDKVSQVKKAYLAWEALHQEYQHLQKNGSPEQARLDLLHYQINELEALAVKPDEINALHQEHDQLAHSKAYIEAAENALAMLDTHDESNAIALISQTQYALKTLTDKFPALKNVKACLDNAHIQLQEALSDIQDFINTLEVNPERLHEVSKRLDHLHDMARKHKIAPEDLHTHCDKLKEEASKYAKAQSRLTQLAQDLTSSAKQYQRVASTLSAARKSTAQRLSAEVSHMMAELGMPGGVFRVELAPYPENEIHLHGNESAHFLVSANPGHSPGPLHKVASGGELSRISLALSLLTAKYLATPTLVFDEVDVGISGKTGSIVGKALANLSAYSQVICITHLAQVAALGAHHIQVTKTRKDDSTISEIHLLNANQRIEEVARLLGGIDITPQARANAKQLLKPTPQTA